MSTWNLEGTQHHFLICNGGSCMQNGGEEVTLAIREEIKDQDAHAKIHTTRTRCNGRCEDACVVISYPEGTWYKNVTPELGKELVKQTLEGKSSLHNVTYTFNQENKGFFPIGNAAKGIEKTILK